MSDNQMSAAIQAQLQGAHEVLEGTMADVTAEQAHWTPPGVANPLGATYAHILTTEDSIINGIIKGGAPLFASDMAGRVGISEPPPGPSPDSPGLPDWAEWSRSVEVDLTAMRNYAQAVYAATGEYLSSASDAELNRSIDLSAIGLDERTVGQLCGILLSNAQWHTGEIACLKGIQGAKGYPF